MYIVCGGAIHRITEGIEGLGEPSANVVYNPDEEVKSGAFTSLRVTKEVADALASGRNSYFYAQEDGDDSYILRPQLPEKFESPGRSFSIRKNINYMTIGIANLFIGENGEINLEDGSKTLCDFHFSLTSADDNNYSKRANKICDILAKKAGIKNKAERDDFNMCMRELVMKKSVNGPYTHIPFADILSTWINWAEEMTQFQKLDNALKMPGDMSGLNRAELMEVVDSCRGGVDNSYNELRALAGADASKERILLSTDCEYCSGFLRDVENKFGRDGNQGIIRANLRGSDGTQFQWDFHQACIVARPKINGRDMIVTLETFAPKTTSFGVHAGSTSDVYIGIYKDAADFSRYYEEGSERISENKVTMFERAKRFRVMDKGAVTPAVRKKSLFDFLSSEQKSKSTKFSFSKEPSLSSDSPRKKR